MTTLPVTSLYTALLLLLLLALAVNVVRWRRQAQVSLGDGDHADLRRAIRAHGNAIEHIPPVMIGLALLEMSGASVLLLHGYGAVFFIARAMHPLGLVRKPSVNAPRQLGVLVTWIVMLAIAVHLLVTVTVH
ncbi:MAG: MAPEG family protein [Alcanivoracaceae bacterium]